MSFLTCSIQSGSNGNCIYVETPDARLLFDAGVSGKCAQARLAHHNRDIRQIDALIISHDHSDHTRSAGIFNRKFGLPVFITQGSLSACINPLGSISDVRTFEPAQTLEFNTTRVRTIPTPHDGVDGVAFIIEHDDKSLGIFTDLGHPFPGLDACLENLDALYLESNYDPDMLANGPYPRWLQNRIAGPRGHLSNLDAATLIKSCAPKKLQWLILAHLSEHNNHPDLALAAARQLLSPSLPIACASRHEPSDLLTIR